MTSTRPHRALVLTAVLTALALGSCAQEEPAAQPAEPYVLTSFYPLTYFGQRIANDTVRVECPLPAGADPEFWRPTRHDIADYQGASLILINGASFEKWVDQVSLPRSRVVDTTRAFADRLLQFAKVTHSHGAGGEHTHAGVDGHTWLDPINAKLQSQAIHDALANAFPAHAATFASGLTALQRDLDALDARLRSISAEFGDRKLLAAHPAYNYLGSRYGWKIVNLALYPQAELDAAVLAVTAATEGAAGSVLLWESEPKASVTAALATRGVRSVVFAPLENIEAGGDYLARMHGNLDRLQAACK